MQNFIVLGYVPGTQIQINFSGWLAILLAITSILFLKSLIRHRQALYELLLGICASWIISMEQLEFTLATK